MKNMIHYYALLFKSPVRCMDALAQDQRPVRLGFMLMLFPLVGYTLMYIFLTIAHGAPSVFTPWLNISKEAYYAANRWLLAPSLLLAWIGASGLMQILGGAVGGRGSFEQTLLVTAFSISVAMAFGLLHDLPMSFCSAVGIIDAGQHEKDMNSPTIWRTLLWSFYSLYGLAFLFLFPLGIHRVHRSGLAASICIGLAGFILFQTVFLVFNR
ncbi:MAG TPA: hypothetical protein VK907_08005 [Phnomibacter sp.]|nr:hypothetical protein [Phnomibacter sp.]